MKRYVIVGGIVAVLIVGAAVLFAGSDSADNTTADTAQPSESSSEEQKEAKETTTDNRSSSPEDRPATGARYVDYSQQSFRDQADRQRILVFVDGTDATSQALESLLKNSLAELPENTTLYRTDIAKHQDIATTLGVTQPGIAIKFNADTNLAGIYIAPETPDISIFKSSLQLEEQVSSSPESD